MFFFCLFRQTFIASIKLIKVSVTVTYAFLFLLGMSKCMRKPTIWVPTRSDTNWPVQSQEKVRSFLFMRTRDCTICVAKTNPLISFADTVKLVCAFGFAYANCWFSHVAACIFTIISISSCKFLQVAANVSDVPNSKYHSLFFILKNKMDCLVGKPTMWFSNRSDTNRPAQ